MTLAENENAKNSRTFDIVHGVEDIQIGKSSDIFLTIVFVALSIGVVVV